MTQLHGMMTVARMRTTSASGSREAADARPGEEMRRPVRVSIIICTYNRAESLSRTLDALSAVQVPATLRAEVIVVDNGSTDATPAIVRSCRMLDGAAPHYISEPRRGQCFARNRGLAQAGGDVIIFIDDDVRPTPGWLAALCRPLVEGRADAVVGAMELGPELERPWMKAFHRVWLTSTEHLRADEPPPNMVGANMAFARRVLARVPQFDTDLGPGALGYHDDVLFSRQLAEAGFRIAFVPDALARHHFEPARTTRAGLIDMAERAGRSSAYVAHHWEHQIVRLPRLRWLRAAARLAIYRLADKGEPRCDSAPVWEMQLVGDVAFYKQYVRDRSRPRHYARHGLVRAKPGHAPTQAHVPLTLSAAT